MEYQVQLELMEPLDLKERKDDRENLDHMVHLDLLYVMRKLHYKYRTFHLISRDNVEVKVCEETKDPLDPVERKEIKDFQARLDPRDLRYTYVK